LKINGLNKPLRIYASDAFDFHGDKGTIIKNVCIQENIERAVFVDDSAPHLASCNGLNGLSCIQALWGYVAPNSAANNISEVSSLIFRVLGMGSDQSGIL
jgi:hypothetical protein